MTKSEAIRDAIDDAQAENKRQSLFRLRADRFMSAEYSPEDIADPTFIGVVWPDGGIDYVKRYF